jgi:hypothetical protein
VVGDNFSMNVYSSIIPNSPKAETT